MWKKANNEYFQKPRTQQEANWSKSQNFHGKIARDLKMNRELAQRIARNKLQLKAYYVVEKRPVLNGKAKNDTVSTMP